MLPFGVRPGNQFWSHGQPSPDPSNTGSDGSDKCIPDPGPQVFNPTLVDVLNVRHWLQWKVPHGLPEELIDMIVDAAEYWPSVEQKMQDQRIIHKDCDQVLLKTVPFCYDRNVCISVLKLAKGLVLMVCFFFRAWNRNRILHRCRIAEHTLAARLSSISHLTTKAAGDSARICMSIHGLGLTPK